MLYVNITIQYNLLKSEVLSCSNSQLKMYAHVMLSHEVNINERNHDFSKKKKR